MKQIWTNLLKFRTCNHYLPTETERWNTPVENRLFTLSQENDIGDEYHYLFKCKYFNDKRKMFIRKEGNVLFNDALNTKMFIKPYFYNKPSKLI